MEALPRRFPRAVGSAAHSVRDSRQRNSARAACASAGNHSRAESVGAAPAFSLGNADSPGPAAIWDSGPFPPATPPIRPTNSWCAWGFALSLVGFCFTWLCGIGALPALVAVVLCIIGLVQVNKNHGQSGLSLAITGLIFSGVALLVAILILWWFVPPMLKAHGLTVTEQTSNDSE